MIRYNIPIEYNPYCKKYNLWEKILTSLSFLCFIIAVILPDGSHINNALIILMITTFLHHYADLYLKYSNPIYLLFEKIDHIAIVNLGLSFFKIQSIYQYVLYPFICLDRKMKDLILVIIYGCILYKIYCISPILLLHLLCVICLASIVFLNMITSGWYFTNSWLWHLCSLHIFIAMKFICI